MAWCPCLGASGTLGANGGPSSMAPALWEVPTRVRGRTACQGAVHTPGSRSGPVTHPTGERCREGRRAAHHTASSVAGYHVGSGDLGMGRACTQSNGFSCPLGALQEGLQSCGAAAAVQPDLRQGPQDG